LTPCFNRFLLLCALAVMPLVPCGCGNAPAGGAARASVQSLDLPSLDGRRHLTLEQNRGKVVLLGFWSVYCGACDEAQPFFARISGRMDKAAFSLITVNTGDDPEDVRAYAAEKKIKYPVGLDTGHKAVSAFRVRGTPAFILLDKKGAERARWLGYFPDLESDIESAIKKIMAEPA